MLKLKEHPRKKMLHLLRGKWVGLSVPRCGYLLCFSHLSNGLNSETLTTFTFSTYSFGLKRLRPSKLYAIIYWCFNESERHIFPIVSVMDHLFKEAMFRFESHCPEFHQLPTAANKMWVVINEVVFRPQSELWKCTGEQLTTIQ